MNTYRVNGHINFQKIGNHTIEFVRDEAIIREKIVRHLMNVPGWHSVYDVCEELFPDLVDDRKHKKYLLRNLKHLSTKQARPLEFRDVSKHNAKTTMLEFKFRG